MMVLAISLSLLWLAWTLRVWHKHRTPELSATPLPTSVLVAYASQTGTARAMALQQQQALGGPQHASMMALSELMPEQLATVHKAFFVVSTYGDGEPPDNGRRFYRDLQALGQQSAFLASLAYEVIALGDRAYPKFCQFGDNLYQQLARLGAQASSPIRKLDQSQLVSSPEVAASSWRLASRERLNTAADPGLFLLRLQATETLPSWRAGDLVAIRPNNDLQAVPRRYSIASAPADDELHLVVRQYLTEEGRMGACSGWLTEGAVLGSNLNLQVIENDACHINDHQSPLLLIGAGSGLAGILSHLSERAQQQNAGPTWLIYGERAADPDQGLHHELERWKERTVLQTVDYACSRDANHPTYVQDIMRENMAAIASFIGTNGHIYVCGRYAGMGTAVDTVLRSALGVGAYQQLLEQGRYHRDLY